MPEHVVPGTSITRYAGTTVFVQGYDVARGQFDEATRLDGKSAGPIPEWTTDRVFI